MASSFDQVAEWRRRLLWALDNKVYRDDEDPRPRRALVLLNPFGGAGAARQNWEHVQSMFDQAHIDYTLTETQEAQHAYEIVNSQIVPGQYDAIISVSGDGLLHEIVNGLLNREDWN